MSRQEWLIVGATAAVVMSQFLVGTWIASEMRYARDSIPDYRDQLSELQDSVDELVKNTKPAPSYTDFLPPPLKLP